MFENVQQGPADPMFDLKKAADNDTSSDKIDLGVGIYRNKEGCYHEMSVLKWVSLSTRFRAPGNPCSDKLCMIQAKKTLHERNPGHDV